jgi:hypothetical protein
VTPRTNQRVHLAQLCYDWSKDPALNGEATGGVAFLDAKITGWNLRDKKVSCLLECACYSVLRMRRCVSPINCDNRALDVFSLARLQPSR